MVGAPPSVAMHGRQQELQVLDAALSEVVSGRNAVAFIEGEAGIGKSRLLDETLQQAEDAGFQVVRGRGEELERSRPFGVVAEAFGCSESSDDPRRAAIARLLAVQGESGRSPVTVTSDPGLQFRAVDAFVDLVENLALQSPLVIGLDDLQWADPSSILTVATLGRRLSYLPVALLGCYRPAPQVASLQRAVDALTSAGAHRIVVRPLPDEAVSDLITETLAATPGPGLLGEIRGAGGNPLFVLELLGAIQQEGILETAGGRAEVTQLALPPTLRLTILRRLSFLSEETMQALQSATILGTSFTLTDLAISTARPAIALSYAVADAIVAGVLADDGSRLRFRHDLIRDAIYEDLPGSVRLALHRETGHRLAESGAPSRQVAEHLSRGAVPGESEAVTWLTNAAREAVSGSPDIAVDLFDRVIELTGPAGQDRDRIRAERAGSLMWAGRVAEAEAACRAVITSSLDPAAAGSARGCLGLVLLTSGRPREALEELWQAGEAPLLDSSERASGFGWACVARMWLGDLAGTAETLTQAREAAVATGDEMTLTIATSMDAVVALLRGEFEAAFRLIESAVDQADRRSGRGGLRYPVYAPRGFILMELDRFREARFSLDTGTRISEELGVRWHQPSYLMAYAVERFLTGDWEDAVSEVQASDEFAADTGESYNLIITHGVLALICLHRNDLAGAASAVARAIRQREATGARYRSQWAVLARARLQEAEGDVSGACATLSEAWDECTRLGLLIEYRVLGPDLVRLALGVGDVPRARATAAGVAALAVDNDIASLTGAALRCRGLAEDDCDLLQAAVEAYGESPRVLELAATCEDAGSAWLRRGELARGRALVERALASYEQLDMSRDIARAEATLRGAGVRRGARTSRRRPKVGWESLTPAEETVARLVAEGLSNPQIGDRLYVSRRTVQTHLGHVFVKLGISSRTHLAAEVTRQLGALSH